MKNKIIKTILLLSVASSLISCKEAIEPPTFVISFTQKYTSYKAPGTFGLPELFHERGEPDYFTLETPEECKDGYFLDERTGEVSWDSSLPHGHWHIKLTAHNEGGSSSSTISVYNTLRGTFNGRRQDPEGNYLDEEPFTFKIYDTQSFISHPEYGDDVHDYDMDGTDSYRFSFLYDEVGQLLFTLELMRKEGDLLLTGTWEDIRPMGKNGQISLIFEP